MIDENIVTKLIDAGRILAGEGHSDMTRGHISVRTSDDAGGFLIKPHTFGLEEMTRANLTSCDLAGVRISGGPRHSEAFIHSEIYRARPDVSCVLHTHPDHVVAFSSTGLELRPWSQPACVFFEQLPTFAETVDLIRSPEQAAGVARALGPHRAVLMRSHGVAVAGGSIEEAVILSIMLENACRMQLLTLSAGRAAPEYPRDDIQALRAKILDFEQHRINFEYLRRKYAQPSPSRADR
jgi:ribulose-5-phosphate 4-epimerase/fuculose-1-phosphate aldolase